MFEKTKKKPEYTVYVTFKCDFIWHYANALCEIEIDIRPSN